MDSAERAYYTALFQRDFREAQRLYRELCCSDAWTPDRVVREAHKCGLYDEADRDDEPIRLGSQAPLHPAPVPRPVLSAA